MKQALSCESFKKLPINYSSEIGGFVLWTMAKDAKYMILPFI